MGQQKLKHVYFLQQLGANVFGYEILQDYQINNYVTPDGKQIFGKAPDSQKALCCWKVIK